MNARGAILATGDELITGRRVDTNSSTVQSRLLSCGVEVVECRQVGDDIGQISRALDELAQRADHVVVTGGLGPTEDDKVRDAVSHWTGRALVENTQAKRDLMERFARWGREPSPSNLRQIMLPEGAELLANPVGTAPGFMVMHQDTSVWALPGVPFEMVQMLEEQVVPRLVAGGCAALDQRVLQVVGLTESALGELLQPWMSGDVPERPVVGITAHAGTMTVSLRGRDVEAIDRVLAEIRDELGSRVFAEGDVSLASVVVDLLRESGATLASAESCTGGMISAEITSVPGASDVFVEGFVTYSNEAKARTISVSQGTLDAHGAVSAETAIEMAAGARQRAHSTHAVSVTGVAGPGGGTADKPVGTVFLGLASHAGASHRALNVPGDRERVRQRTTVAALNLLRLTLLGSARK